MDQAVKIGRASTLQNDYKQGTWDPSALNGSSSSADPRKTANPERMIKWREIIIITQQNNAQRPRTKVDESPLSCTPGQLAPGHHPATAHATSLSNDSQQICEEEQFIESTSQRGHKN